MTYRAAYWTDGQQKVVLTLPEESFMEDADLLVAAETEAEFTGLDSGPGEIEIGEWTD